MASGQIPGKVQPPSQARLGTAASHANHSNSSDGGGKAARFSHPNGIAVGADGSLYVADTENQTIRKITRTGVVSTVAGSPGQTGSLDGTGAQARFYNPTGIAVARDGTLYVADKENHTIRKITTTGVVRVYPNRLKRVVF